MMEKKPNNKWPSVIPLEDSWIWLKPVSGLPISLYPELQRLEAYINQERGLLWNKKEVEAAHRLFETENLAPVWQHLGQFIERHYWFELIVDVFLRPYGYPEEPRWEEEAAKDNAQEYAHLAELAYELLEHSKSFLEDTPGYMEEVEDLIETTNLRKTLLKLISLTTACRWPKLEYGWLYAPESEKPPFIEVGDCKNAETFMVYEASQSKKTNNPIGLDYAGYKYTGDVFKRNARYDGRFEQLPPYDYTADPDKEIPLERGQERPSKFESLPLGDYSAKRLKANKVYMAYLKALIWRLDNFSDELGRPRRVWNNGSQNGISHRDPLWLRVSDCHLILGALFGEDPGVEEIENSQITREFRLIQDPPTP